MQTDELKNTNELSEVGRMMKDDANESGGGILQFAGELIKIVFIALAIIIPVRYFLIKPFYVNGASMEPNYHNREYLIVDEISYRFKGPSRGEVVVFRYPIDPKQFFIKRIIGLPGERVVIKDDQVIIYNKDNELGRVLNEPYLSDSAITHGSNDITLGENEYFVLGDNRTASLDSRRFGAVPGDNLIGRSWLRGWPLDRLGVLDHYTFDF